MTETSVNIITYNLLSSNLSDPSFIIGSTYDNCDPEKRFSKILKIFDELIKDRYIICLQELSQKWEGYLHTFFSEREYYLITRLYGKEFNGYMGVAIAYPLTKYKLLDCDINVIGDSELLKINNSYSQQNFIGKLFSYFSKFFVKNKKEVDNFKLAKIRKNSVINLRLISRLENSEPFCVSTYHMPCSFSNQKLMVIHAAILGHIINNFVNGYPYILCGDFNSIPNSPVYKLLTEGNLDINDESHPTPLHWSIKQKQSLRSVYYDFHNTEPPFTYISKNKWGEYESTLDYIFCSDNWIIGDVEVVGLDPENKEWCPSSTQPSDHYMIRCELNSNIN